MDGGRSHQADLSMDRATSIAVCRGVGESLRRLAADAGEPPLPDRLRVLVDELRRREASSRRN